MNIEELLRAPSLDGQFPITFSNGYQVSTIHFECTACKRPAPLKQVSGYISRIVENTVDVRAVMQCPCGLINRYQFRLRNERSYSHLKDGTWIHVTTKTPLHEKVIKYYKFKFHACLLVWKLIMMKRHLNKLQTVLKCIKTSRK